MNVTFFSILIMRKKQLTKIIGNVAKEIANKWYLNEQIDKPILLESGLYKHIAHHSREYKSLESHNYTMNHIEDVINNPDFVFYNVSKNGIEYYKKLIEDVVVIVTPTKKRKLYISSIYPVNKSKILNRIIREKSEINKTKKKYEKELIEKYFKKDNKSVKNTQ